MSHFCAKKFALLIMFMLAACGASAADYTVTDVNDNFNGDGLVSLREAILNAILAGGTKTIDFDATVFATPQTIQLTSALPDINITSLTITGPGANLLTISGQGTSRIFRVPSPRSLTVSGLTLSNGYFSGAAGGNGAAGGVGQGGAISNSGRLTLTDCVLSGNTVFGGAGGAGARNTGQNGGAGADGFGGAIFSDGPSLTIARCTFSGNYCYGGGGGAGADADAPNPIGNGAAAGSGWGGALYVAAGATCTISNSTFHGNTVQGGTGGSGGALPSPAIPIGTGGLGGNADGGAIYTLSAITMTSCTIAAGGANAGDGGYHIDPQFNTRFTPGNAHGGGLNANGTITLGTCLVASNTVTNPSSGQAQGPDLFGTFTSQNFNLIGAYDANATGINGAADQKGTPGTPIDAKLDPLGATNNGGTVTTVRLRRGSPAVDKGNNVTAGLDQRGSARPVDLADGTYPNVAGGDGSDIGAFESQTLPNDIPVANNHLFNGAQGTVFTGGPVTGSDGDSDPLTFSVATGSMPDGLTLNSDGTITGTPTTPGQFTLTYKANDGQDDSVAKTLNINISETPSLVVNTDIDNSTQYDGKTSLREAVTLAISDGVSTPVTFDATFFTSSKTITLDSTISIFNQEIDIRGPAAGVTISGGNTVVPFKIYDGPVSFKDLTIANGHTTAFDFGSGIYIGNPGHSYDVTLTNCTLKNNGGDDSVGGAIFNNENLTLINCTLAGNHADDTGTGNAGGGAIFQNGGSLTLLNCTVTANHSNGTSGSGGAIEIAGGTLTIGNSIIAGNSATTAPDIAATVNSLGYNLIGDTTGATINGTTTGNQLNVSPGFDAGGLADNGGPTQTIALAAGSLAIDQGKALGGVTTDQRGITRPFEDTNIANAAGGDGSDIGAYEKLAGELISIVADQANNAEGSGSGDTAFTFTVSRTGPTTGDATVNYAVTGSGGNAADAADFGGALPSGTFTIPDTQSSATLTINVSKDATVEANEGFTVTLSSPSGAYILGTSTASGSITNDDKASASTVAASTITTTSATLNGSINGNGASTTVSFDYGETLAFGTNVAGTPSPVTGAVDTPVSADITGLTPNTTYFFRVNGVNSGGTTNATELQFTTLPLPPVATTAAATEVGAFTANLNGIVNASGASTDVTFEYGTTTAYGTTIGGGPSPVSGSSNTSVSVSLIGLQPNTTYHFRVNGTNAGGTSNGSDLTFTTGPSTLSILSGPTATPAFAGVGQTVTFSVSAIDSGNATITYTWDIAGTAATGATPTRVFTAPGTYTATFTGTTSVGGMVTASVLVTVVAPAVGTGNDTDGDGFSDDFEIAAGTSPLSATDSPTGGTVPTTAVLTVTKASIKLSFAKPNLDSIAFSGTLPVAAGFSPASKTITVDVGGVVKAITLDAKGKSKDFKLTVKATKGVVAAQTAKYSVKLQKGSFASLLIDDGLINGDAKLASASVLIRVVFAGVIYEKPQPLTYSAKAGKTGKASVPK